MTSSDRTPEPGASRPVATGAPSAWSWVPIRSLGPRHRIRIIDHLKALPPTDRYLRFGHEASDAQMSKYVDLLDFERDEVFGIFNRRLALIAMAHLAHPTAIAGSHHGDATTMSEFGVSVLPGARGRGFGRRLFEHAMLHARNRGIDTLFIHALSENRAMLRIARNAGAMVERHGSESEARLKLPPDTLSSHVGELIEHQAAEFDYRWKRGARQVGELFSAFGDGTVAATEHGDTATLAGGGRRRPR